MTRYDLSLTGTTSSWFYGVYAGLPGGHFVTAGTPVADSIALYAASDPATQLDYWPTETAKLRMSQNVAGQVYAIGSATSTTHYLASVSESAGALTMGTAGTFTAGTATYSVNGFSLSDDGTEVMAWCQVDKLFYIINTADASIASTTSINVGNEANSRIAAAAGGTRAVGTNGVYGYFTLWDGPTDTLLDTLAYGRTISGANPKQVLPIGTDRLFFALAIDEGADPLQLLIGVLSTAGDVLSYEWSAVLATGWADATVQECMVAVHDGVAVIAPRETFSGSPNLIYAVDTITGAVSTSASTALGVGASVERMHFCGAGVFMWFDNGGYELRVWSIAALPTYLRLHQSPAYAPSRVRPTDLRQRQTSVIR